MSSVCFKCNGLLFLRLVDCSVSYTACGEIMRYKMAQFALSYILSILYHNCQAIVFGLYSVLEYTLNSLLLTAAVCFAFFDSRE